MHAMNRRSFIEGSLLMALGCLSGCSSNNGGNGSSSDSSADLADKRKSLGEFVGSYYDSQYDHGISVYTNSNLSEVYVGTIGSILGLDKISNKDGDYTVDIVGDFSLPASVSLDTEVSSYTKKPTIEENIKSSAQQAYAALQKHLYDPDSAAYDGDIEACFYDSSSFEDLGIMNSLKNGQCEIGGYGYLIKFMVNAKNRLGGHAGERGIILFSAPLVESWLELDEDNSSYSYVTQVMADVKEKLPWLYGSYSNTELAS